MEKFTKLKFWMLAITVMACIGSLLSIPDLYKDTLSGSDIKMKTKEKYNLSSDNTPVWFLCKDDTMHTFQPVQTEDKQVLYSLMDRNDSLYQFYCKDVDALTYRSNTVSPHISSLLWLTLCFVLLGCGARSLYDYIGWECFKDGQEMCKWWPWYLFRPIMCAPIAAFLLVAVRTAMFSSLFSARDLNTYVVVAFLCGFGMMEFLKMLRRVSKGIFGESN